MRDLTEEERQRIAKEVSQELEEERCRNGYMSVDVYNHEFICRVLRRQEELKNK